jgi:hypothetical protein
MANSLPGTSVNRLNFMDANGSPAVSLAARAGATEHPAILLPTTAGTPGQVLSTDGGSPHQQLSWGTPSSGSGPATILSGGTDAINPHASASYIVTTPGVDSMSIVAPTVGTDDGVTITITNGSSASHTVTFTGGTLRSGGAGVTTATFGGFPGSSFTFYAHQGVWFVQSQNLMASYS